MEDDIPVTTYDASLEDDNSAKYLARSLQELLYLAFTSGYVITVDLQALEPLAMGNYRMIGDVRKGRCMSVLTSCRKRQRKE